MFKAYFREKTNTFAEKLKRSYMKQYIITIILALCLGSCGQHSKHWETLTQIETFVEENPDSALSVLQCIEVDDLSGSEEKAKHALLLLMALDKNDVAETDFEILHPAIDYYKNNGTPTEQMLTLFYQGQIHRINSQYAQALACFGEAIKIDENSKDIQTKARIYDAQGDVYRVLTKWDETIKSKLCAAEYFSKLNNTDSYVSSLLDVFYTYTQNGDSISAGRYHNKCNDYLKDISSKTRNKYYCYYLNYLIATNKLNVIENTIQEYLSEVPANNLDYLSLAYAYMALGDINKVAESLSKNELPADKENILRQYAIVAALNAHMQEGRDMLKSSKEFFIERDSLIYSLYENDIQYMHQKNSAKLQQEREELKKHTKTIIITSVILVLLIALYLLRKRLQNSRTKNIILESEKTLYENMYKEVLSERDSLNDMLTNSSIREETMTIIRKRLEVLNAIVVSHLSDRESDSKRANEQLQNLIANREVFIKSTRLTLEENYPHFFAYLHEKGLEEFEIDFCCLYAIGMKGKEVKAYTNLNRHYKDSSEVRQKLGLVESDTNLSNFLQKLLKNGFE